MGRDSSRKSGAVTLQDIAERCGLSKATVSWALRRNTQNVSIDTINRVITTACEMGYDPSVHHAARCLAHTRTGHLVSNQAVGIFLTPESIGFHYFQEILRGILDTLHAHQFSAVFHYAGEHVPVELAPVVKRGGIDGAIVLTSRWEFMPFLDSLRADPQFGDRPVVSISDTLPGCTEVLSNDEEPACAMMRHLLELGHRKILHGCTSDISHTFAQRIKGYHRAVADFSLAPDDILYASTFMYFTSEEMRTALNNALKKYPDATAILAPNDYSAVLMLNALAEMGRRVPEDISLVGHDDTDAAPDAEGRNRLTTVRLPLRRMGETAAEHMIARIRGESSEIVESVLPARAVYRSTTAAAIS